MLAVQFSMLVAVVVVLMCHDLIQQEQAVMAAVATAVTVVHLAEQPELQTQAAVVVVLETAAQAAAQAVQEL
jgi:hypothetical protein